MTWGVCASADFCVTLFTGEGRSACTLVAVDVIGAYCAVETLAQRTGWSLASRPGVTRRAPVMEDQMKFRSIINFMRFFNYHMIRNELHLVPTSLRSDVAISVLWQYKYIFCQ